MLRFKGLILFAIGNFLTLVVFAAPGTETPEADTQHNLRSESPSKVIKKSPWDYIRFVYNRGKGSNNFLDLVLEQSKIENIKALPGYKSPSKTRLNYKTYEFRSIEVYKDLVEKLKAGFKVRLVADAGPHQKIPALSSKEYDALSSEQKSYYDYQYLNRQSEYEEVDGVRRLRFVSHPDLSQEEVQKRIDEFNLERSRDVSVEMMKKLDALSKKYPKSFELVQTPREFVPKDSRDNYVRLSHFKGYRIDFLDAKGNWVPAINIECSANATDSCMGKGRISASEGNKKKYVSGEPYALSKGSQGNIQFGSQIQGTELLQLLEGPVEDWIKAYKDGKHFDEILPPEKNWPIVVFDDPKTGHQSLLRSYFSEGTKHPFKTTNDLVYHAATDIWSRPEITLVEYLGSEFVMTHTQLASNLRHQLWKAQEAGTLENAEIYVDANFATKPYSALPNLLFTIGRGNSPGVLSGKALKEGKPFPEELNWQKQVQVFEGHREVYGSEGDKLHTKLRYFSYLNGQGKKHYVVIWGSGNNSKNANKLNADVVRSLDTTDPKLEKVMHRFFDALRADSKMRPYANAYLEKLFYQTINYNDQDRVFPGGSIADVTGPDTFLSRFQSILDGKDHNNKKLSPKKRHELLGKLLVVLEDVGPQNDHGSNFLKTLRWYYENVSLTRPLNWADLSLLQALSNPEDYPQKGLVQDYLDRWFQKDAHKKQKSFQKLVGELFYSEKSKGRATKLSPTVMRLFQNCDNWFRANGVGNFEGLQAVGGK